VFTVALLVPALAKAPMLALSQSTFSPSTATTGTIHRPPCFKTTTNALFTKKQKTKVATNAKSYNSRYLLVVTYLTTTPLLVRNVSLGTPSPPCQKSRNIGSDTTLSS
jgi:hypothetical protein